MTLLRDTLFKYSQNFDDRSIWRMMSMKGRVIRNPEVTRSVLTSWVRLRQTWVISFFFFYFSYELLFSQLFQSSLSNTREKRKLNLNFLSRCFASLWYKYIRYVILVIVSSWENFIGFWMYYLVSSIILRNKIDNYTNYLKWIYLDAFGV